LNEGFNFSSTGTAISKHSRYSEADDTSASLMK